MNKKNLLLIFLVFGVLCCGLVLFIHSGNNVSYEEYVDNTIYVDFDNDSEVVLDFYKLEFTGETVSNYEELEFKQLNEDDIKDILTTMPDWLKEEYNFWPDDCIDYLNCIYAYSQVYNVTSIERSEKISNYIYEDSYQVTLKINGKDIVFLIPYNSEDNTVITYFLEDEIKGL